jgi:hypothetical protein
MNNTNTNSKIPRDKNQIPNKFQAPTDQTRFGTSILVLRAYLEFASWNFS